MVVKSVCCLLQDGVTRAKIDIDFYPTYSKYIWFVNGDGHIYTIIYKNGKKVSLMLAHLVMGYEYDNNCLLFFDHKNQIRSDNRRKNLRICFTFPNNRSFDKIAFYEKSNNIVKLKIMDKTVNFPYNSHKITMEENEIEEEIIKIRNMTPTQSICSDVTLDLSKNSYFTTYPKGRKIIIKKFPFGPNQKYDWWEAKFSAERYTEK